jgi:hypothetical protein
MYATPRKAAIRNAERPSTGGMICPAVDAVASIAAAIGRE